jgi:hypothetical protein
MAQTYTENEDRILHTSHWREEILDTRRKEKERQRTITFKALRTDL